MRISTATSSHLAGMSALWHDAEYIPEKQLYTPTVERGLEGMPLPSERHILPEGVEDPFAVQEKAYDVAAAQMERGIKGMEFLHGKGSRRFDEVSSPGEKPPVATSSPLRDGPSMKRMADPLAEASDVTRTLLANSHSDPGAPSPARSLQVADARATDDQIQKRAEAGQAPPKVSNATAEHSATQKSQRAQKALEMAEGLGVAMAGVALSQAVEPTGLAGAAAAEAAAVVKAAAVAKLSVSMSGSIADMPEAVRTAKARERRSAQILGDDDEGGQKG